jgi:hypothetical protein
MIDHPETRSTPVSHGFDGSDTGRRKFSRKFEPSSRILLSAACMYERGVLLSHEQPYRTGRQLVRRFWRECARSPSPALPLSPSPRARSLRARTLRRPRARTLRRRVPALSVPALSVARAPALSVAARPLSPCPLSLGPPACSVAARSLAPGAPHPCGGPARGRAPLDDAGASGSPEPAG